MVFSVHLDQRVKLYDDHILRGDNHGAPGANIRAAPPRGDGEHVLSPALSRLNISALIMKVSVGVGSDITTLQLSQVVEVVGLQGGDVRRRINKIYRSV